MPKQPYNPGAVWVDLDETLIYSYEVEICRLIKRPIPEAAVETEYPGVRTLIRPGARGFLGLLRARLKGRAPVRLLTVGAHAYAWAINQKFQLGFERSEIVAREQWLCTDFDTPQPLGCQVDPQGVLLNDEEGWRIKQEYLGVRRARVVLVPSYTGSRMVAGKPRDEDCRFLQGRAVRLVSRIERILRQKHTPLKNPDKTCNHPQTSSGVLTSIGEESSVDPIAVFERSSIRKSPRP